MRSLLIALLLAAATAEQVSFTDFVSKSLDAKTIGRVATTVTDKTIPQLVEVTQEAATDALAFVNREAHTLPAKAQELGLSVYAAGYGQFERVRNATKKTLAPYTAQVGGPDVVEFVAGFVASFLVLGVVAYVASVLIPAAADLLMMLLAFRFVLLIALYRAIWMTVATTLAAVFLAASTLTDADPIYAVCVDSQVDCSTLGYALGAVYIVILFCNLVAFLRGPLGLFGNVVIVTLWLCVGLILLWTASSMSPVVLVIDGAVDVYTTVFALTFFCNLVAYQQIGIARPRVVYKGPQPKDQAPAKSQAKAPADSDYMTAKAPTPKVSKKKASA